MKNNNIVAEAKPSAKGSAASNSKSRKSKFDKTAARTEIPFLMVPSVDRRVVRKYGLGLQDYWLDCWEADPYGSRYVLMPDTKFKSTTQAKYRKQLETLGLFMFEIRSQGGDRKLWVLNRHGSRVKSFWKSTADSLDSVEEPLDQTEQSHDSVEEPLDQTEQSRDEIEEKLDEIEQNNSGTQSQQAFQNPSTSSQKRLINLTFPAIY